ncbi:MAG: class I SAM-dependent methyltransferase [Bacteroidetes bacterium]|nr:class I SAM-dependent methyltransferase [Bacteroidota bacterium]
MRPPKCRICGNTEKNRLFVIREMMFGTGESFDYFQCARCNCLQLNEIPADLSTYYESEYYSLANDPSKENKIARVVHNLRADQSLKRTRLGRYLLNVFPNYVLDAMSKIELHKSTRILDVGCGNGSLIYCLKEIGFKNVMGIDPFIKADTIYDNGTQLKKTTLEATTGSWDIVMLYDSFEHMPNPAEAVRSMSSLLSNDGVIIMTIPTVSSYAWETYGTHWVQLDAPRHLFLHSLESLRFLARHGGLVIEKMIYNSTDFQFWGSEQCQRSIPLFSETSYATNPSKSIFRKTQIKEFKKEALRLNRENRGDQLAVYLRKNGN